MSISYPTQQHQIAQTGSTTANFFKYAVGQFTQNTQINHTSSYTASYDVSSWIVNVNGSVPTGSTIKIAMPTSSFVTSSNNLAPHFYTPALEFWRVDPVNVNVLLSSSNPNVVFGFNMDSTFLLPTSSYTNIVQIDLGFDQNQGPLIYLCLEQSQI